MDHTVAVRVIERARYRRGEANGVLNWELLLTVNPVSKTFAIDERHHIEQQSVGFSRVEQGKEIRMLEAGRYLDFGEKPLDAEDRGQLGLSTLRATLRWCRTSRARYTVAMPPRPTSRSRS
jgi:hypothetical protein